MWLTVLVVADVLLALAALPLVLFQRREPTATMAWALAVIFLPYIGPLLFFLVGSRRGPERKLRRFRRKTHGFRHDAWGAPAVGDGSDNFEREEFRSMATALEAMSGLPARPGNHVEFFADAAPTREALLSAIRSAQHHVHLEYYIFQNDEAGNEVAEALCERARAGVECRLLLDAVGAMWFAPACQALLEQNGVKVAFFHPTNPLRKRWHLNYRLHRKIAVIDGTVAFTGGRNIGNEYLKSRLGKRTWQDLHLLLRGPAVLDLQGIFLKDWYFTTDEHLATADYCPKPRRAGDQVVQVVPSEPHSSGSPVEFAHLLALRNARHSLRIATPYFVPTESMRSALIAAALSGVAVEIIVPVESDSKLALWAGRSAYRELTEAGIRIREYRKGMLHGKLMIVDDHWCTAGSANMDFRSFRLSFEVNVVVYDRAACAQLAGYFEQYQAHADLVRDPHRYEQRFPDRLFCAVARLVSPLL